MPVKPTPAALAKSLGVTITGMPQYEKGPQPPPALIKDFKRGPVWLLTPRKGPLSKIFLADFIMKPLEPRGKSHTTADTYFFVTEGSCVLMCTDQRFKKISVQRVDAPKTIHVRPGTTHVFMPITRGRIIEFSPDGTNAVLDGNVKHAELDPLVDRLKKEIRGGLWSEPEAVAVW